MDFISLALLIATGAVILSMLVLDLQRYKFVYLGFIIALGVSLYFYGMIYNVENPNYLDLILKSFGNTSQFFRGVFPTASIMDRINNDFLFLISAYAIHVIGFGYTYILIFAIFFKNLSLRMKFNAQKGLPHHLVLGDSSLVTYIMESLEAHYKTQKSLRVNLALPKRLAQEKSIELQYAYKPGVSYFDVDVQPLRSVLQNNSKSEMTLISVYEQDALSLALVEKLAHALSVNPELKIQAYVLYHSPEILKVLETFTRSTNKIHFFSYHQLVARQMLLDYPLTSLVPNLINQDLVTLQGRKIHYNLIGFNETNQEIYKHLLITNQFPPLVLAKLIKIESKPISYHIFAEQGAEYVKQYQFEKPEEKKGISYLPFPSIISASRFFPTKLTGNDLYAQFKEAELKSGHFNAFIIATGSDIENLNLAYKTIEFVQKHRLQSRSKIFVQILNETYIASSSLFKYSIIVPFGIGEKTYAVENIKNPIFKLMAQNIYQSLNLSTPWNKLSNSEQETYFYEAIAIRFKLNLMGLDLQRSKQGLNQTQFYSLYDPEMDKTYNETQLRAKNYHDLDLYKKTGKNKRNLLARQEQLRFSAYRLISGYNPMAIETMVSSRKITDEANKEDIRLTTFEGLLNLQKILLEDLHFSFQDSDYVYPLFHTMDHLFDIIQGTGYAVVDISKDLTIASQEMEKIPLESVESDIKS